MTDPTPTDEQQAALDLYRTGESFLLNALAGTGKSTALIQMARSDPNKRVVISAFNKAIIVDLDKRAPRNTQAVTMHALANRGNGYRFSHRFEGDRVSSRDYARILRTQPLFLNTIDGRRVVQPPVIASSAVQTVLRWCQSDRPEPTAKDVPFLDGVAKAGDPFANQDEVRATVLPYALKVAAEVMNPDSAFPCTASMGHAASLKFWQLYGAGTAASPKKPVVQADVFCADEAQDLSGCMASIFAQQDHLQRVATGDRNQKIYSYLGLVDLFAVHNGWPSLPLTRSFRFGPAVAEIANAVLAVLGADLRVVGAGPESKIGLLNEPSAVIARTNAEAVRAVLEAQRAGRTTHLIGSATELRKFAEGARDLMNNGWTSHADLRIFGSWQECLAYCEADPSGGDLTLLVRLVNEFGVDLIISTLDSTVPASKAEVVASTCHRAKGLGFDSVQLAGDFGEPSDPEAWRIVYVAATRVERLLDLSRCEALTGLLGNRVPRTVLDAEQALAPADGPQLSLSDIFG